jgi:hypothetical protein
MKSIEAAPRKDVEGCNTGNFALGIQREFVGMCMINGIRHYITRYSRDHGRLDGIPASALIPALDFRNS